MRKLRLKIITPKKLVLEREIDSITCPSSTGEITVLPRHSNLLSLLVEGVMTIRQGVETELIAIGGGYLETDGNSVKILVSRAYNQNEIDEKMTQVALEKAKNILAQTKDKTERAEALSIVRRSILDINLLKKVRRPRQT